MSEKQFWSSTLRKIFSLLEVYGKINSSVSKNEYISGEEAFEDFEFHAGQ